MHNITLYYIHYCDTIIKYYTTTTNNNNKALKSNYCLFVNYWKCANHMALFYGGQDKNG